MSTVMNTVKQKGFLPTLVPIYLAITFFMIPISSTGKSIFMVLSLLTILMLPSARQTVRTLLTTPWCMLLCIFFVFVCLACCWSPATLQEKALVLEKYSKYLYLPILVVGFQTARVREVALHAFLVAMSLTCLISLSKAASAWAMGEWLTLANLDVGAVFRNHIMTSYMMAFAAYLSTTYFFETFSPVTAFKKYSSRSLLHAISMSRGLSAVSDDIDTAGSIGSAMTKRLRWLYAVMSILFTLQVLFVNTGRTGYIVYFVLMGTLVLQRLSWRKAWLALLGIVFFATLCVWSSPMIQERIQHTISDWRHYHQDDKDTPIGYRLQFHRYAASLYRQSPFWGQGTAAFTHLYAKDQPIASWTRRLLEPHSQYWLTAVELGAIGMGLFLSMMAAFIFAALQLKRMRPIAIALIVSFLLCCFTDSFLFYSGTGYFFILLLALCLGEHENHREQNLSCA